MGEYEPASYPVSGSSRQVRLTSASADRANSPVDRPKTATADCRPAAGVTPLPPRETTISPLRGQGFGRSAHGRTTASWSATLQWTLPRPLVGLYGLGNDLEAP